MNDDLKRRLTIAIEIATNESAPVGVDLNVIQSPVMRYALDKMQQQLAYILRVLIEIKAESEPTPSVAASIESR